MQRRVFISALMAACAATPLWAASPSPSPANTITIDDYEFSPKELHVKTGATVTWVNHDEVQHRIMGANNLFKSDPLDANKTFQYRFTTPGTFEYGCGYHSSMRGKVVVS